MHDDDICDGLCGEIGPRRGPGLVPYMCSLEAGHDGVHKAVLDGDLLDSWPAT